MNRVLLLDTSVFSRNMGDQIIVESIHRHMRQLLERSFIINAPTHIPIMNYRILLSKRFVQWTARQCDYKFVCGTNLLTAKRRLFPLSMAALWQIGFPSIYLLGGSVLVGAGLGSSDTKPNYLSKVFYKRLLSVDFIHSVRDSQAMQFMANLGIKAINTGCPTTWGLTEEHCRGIPISKSKNVIFTITDYRKDPLRDQMMVDTLLRNYENVYFLPQGFYDYDYFCTLKRREKIQLIAPNLSAYKNFLGNICVDYVGTRLHGGILAMLYCKRSIIISVDNRTEAINNDINLNMLNRDSIETLDTMLNSNLPTKLNINFNGINEWLKQF